MVCLDVSRHTVSKSIMQISFLIFLDLSLHLATNYISKKKLQNLSISFYLSQKWLVLYLRHISQKVKIWSSYKWKIKTKYKYNGDVIITYFW